MANETHFTDLAGGVLIVSAITLAFLKRSQKGILIFSVLGFALLAIKVVNYMHFGPTEITIKKQIDSAVGSKSAEIEAAIFKIDNFIKDQGKFNSVIAEKIPPGQSKIPEPPASQWTSSTKSTADGAGNTNYKVIIYYKPSRMDQARAIQRSLLAGGFKSAAIQSDLSEIGTDLIPKAKQTSGMTSVVATDLGAVAIDAVDKIVADTLPDYLKKNIFVDREEWDLDRSDIEVYLF